MYALRLHQLLALSLAVVVLGWGQVARAWVEVDVESDTATIEVDRAGKATVRHELVLRVRGGPLPAYELKGVDADAAPLPDATVAALLQSGGAAAARPLLVERQRDDVLRLETDDDQGLRRGRYLMTFGYTTDLAARQALRPSGNAVELRWVGPRFEEGVGAAKVALRVPTAPTAPRVAEADPTQVALGLAEDPGATLVSTLRRGAADDELELVRPHVAKGEPVVYRVLASSRAFDAFGADETSTLAEEPAPVVPERAAHERLAVLGVSVLVAMLYALALGLSWRDARRAAAVAGASPRALAPLPVAWRAPLAGLALGGAFSAGGLGAPPAAAGALLVAAIGLGTLLPSRRAAAARGPGRWLPLGDAEAFADRERRRAVSWLDAGGARGFAVLVGVTAAVVVGAAALFPASPEQAVLLLLTTTSLVPVFFTGRSSEQAGPAGAGALSSLRAVADRLRGDGVRVVAQGRHPIGADVPDEIRLELVPKRSRAGLVAVEVCLEPHRGAGGVPCVLVRVRDGSDARTALPEGLVWARGRRSDERVTILRPRLPTVDMAHALARRVVGLLERPADEAGAPQRPTTRASSSGSARSTAKPSSPGAPAHAMRLACSA
ncbi:MAG: hypothetical protein IT376_09165 [Polyangiaceae bacterium]|nr:hypothetical protein [Polyangiaceae bacterium]